MVSTSKWIKCWVLIALVLMCASCSTVNYEYPKAESNALTVGQANATSWGHYVAKQAASENANEAGFIYLEDGVESFAARLLLANRAEKTLDAQYYLITDDLIGTAFIKMLLNAADRGVRVRLLLDDIQTSGYDTRMAALNAHPNFEIRIFNPFSSRSFRGFDALKFSKLNRRMHNKTFTVDNSVTIIGGRNIAAEYFGAREDVNFGDLDLLAIGPAVPEVSSIFDLYWNSEFALPIPAFAHMPEHPEKDLEQLRLAIDKRLNEAKEGVYAEALKHDLDQLMADHAKRMIWAPYKLAYDTPDKTSTKTKNQEKKITTTLVEAITAGQQEFVCMSPYFVPRKSGEEFIQKLLNKGMEVKIVTNSLAANNHSTVHSGYIPSRKPLLKMGAQLYEVKATEANDRYKRVGTEEANSTLHTKAFLVDRKTVFIGSFNWDPRSVNINTEFGVVIESPKMGQQLGELFDNYLQARTWQVMLDSEGTLNWIDHKVEPNRVYTKEPDTSWWDRFKVGFMRLFPIKGQL